MISYFDVSAGVTVGTCFPDRAQHPATRRALSPVIARPPSLDAPFSSLLLAWLPTYPAGRVWTHRSYHYTTRAGITLPPQPAQVIPLFSWRPILPQRNTTRWHATARMPTYFLPPQGQAIVVGQQLSWLPSYPPPHRWTRGARMPATTVGTLTLGPPAVVFPTTGQCVELANGGLTRPTLLSESVTQPALSSETLTRPAFIDESVC